MNLKLLDKFIIMEFDAKDNSIFVQTMDRGENNGLWIWLFREQTIEIALDRAILSDLKDHDYCYLTLKYYNQIIKQLQYIVTEEITKRNPTTE